MGATKCPCITDILRKMSDDRALTLFNSIAVYDGHIDIYLREMNLSKKQYYSRLAGLKDVGLIRRHGRKYSLTPLGKIVYDAHLKVGKALSYYWKLKAIESVEMSSQSAELPREKLPQLINALIDNHFIKDFLLKEYCEYPSRPSRLYQHQQGQRKKRIRISMKRLVDSP